MSEHVSIRRQKAGVMVNVTHTEGGVKVHWQERVLAPNPESIRTAVRFCRRKCAMLRAGVVRAGEE